MDTLTFKQIKELKVQCEQEINDALDRFEKQSGIVAEEVTVDLIKTCFTQHFTMDRKVTIHISI